MLGKAGRSAAGLVRRHASTSSTSARTSAVARSHTRTSTRTHTRTSTSTSAVSALDGAPSSAPTHYLITQVRSAIGLPHPIKKTLAVLGLKRRQHSVLHPFSGPIAGQILKVKELVTVRNVTQAEGERLAVRRRPEGAGVVLTGRVYGGRSANLDAPETVSAIE